MISLPNITLICLTNRDFEGHKKALEKSCEGIAFGGAKIIWDNSIRNIDDWNYKIIYDLHNYVDTDFAMLIHSDGYIIRPDLWKPDFLLYDFCGAPWPLPTDSYSYRNTSGNIVRVGNSVSLRSKRIMKLPSLLHLEWKPFYGNYNEDGKLCCEWREQFERIGVKYAPIEIAKHFSKEHTIPENEGLETFAFHSL